ncbi:MAG: SusF/SusE family outer membrane protein [Saprospiraceae bacterium]|jgi:hypothetical protein
MRRTLIEKLGVLLLFGGLLVLGSCKEDDDIVIDPGEGGINVGNGWYLAATGADPASTAILAAETVEDDGFTSQARSGFFGGYIYLSAGSYNLVQVTDREVVTTVGGTASEEMDSGSGCDYNTYTVVTTAEGGPAISVGANGLYRVTYDQMTNEMIMYQIEAPSLIGSATENGWGADTPLPGSADASGGSWTASGLVMRQGEFKVRFNCRWNLDRRVDPNLGFDPANGYQFFTNFGGTPENLLTGNDGANMQISAPGSGGPLEEGTFDAELNWDPRNGFSLTMTRTGDAPVVTFDPNDFQFGVIGDATANGWDADRNLYYKGVINGAHTWLGVVTFAETGEFKLRTNDSWDYNLGGALAADGSAATLDLGGANIATPGAGAYYLTITTADEGITWNATMVSGGWSLIGEGSPSMGWDMDTPLNADGFDAGVTTYSYTGDFTEGDWKFRAGGAWDYNLGGDLTGLSADGANLSLPAAGTYTITLSYDGQTYSATADPQ